MDQWLLRQPRGLPLPHECAQRPPRPVELYRHHLCRAGQNLDTGCKVVLNAPETSATVETKGISKSGGIQTFRSSIVATPKAEVPRQP